MLCCLKLHNRSCSRNCLNYNTIAKYKLKQGCHLVTPVVTRTKVGKRGQSLALTFQQIFLTFKQQLSNGANARKPAINLLVSPRQPAKFKHSHDCRSANKPWILSYLFVMCGVTARYVTFSLVYFCCYQIVVTNSRTSNLWRLSPDNTKVVDANPFPTIVSMTESSGVADDEVFNIITSTVHHRGSSWTKEDARLYCDDCEVPSSKRQPKM